MGKPVKSKIESRSVDAALRFRRFQDLRSEQPLAYGVLMPHAAEEKETEKQLRRENSRLRTKEALRESKLQINNKKNSKKPRIGSQKITDPQIKRDVKDERKKGTPERKLVSVLQGKYERQGEVLTRQAINKRLLNLGLKAGTSKKL